MILADNLGKGWCEAKVLNHIFKLFQLYALKSCWLNTAGLYDLYFIEKADKVYKQAFLTLFMVYIIIVIILLLVPAGINLFMQQPQFGALSKGARGKRIQGSKNFRDGQFQNLSHTPSLAEGATYAGVMRKFFFGKSKRSVPSTELPGHHTDLRSLDLNEDYYVWFGHSSYYLQVAGRKFLVDPVFSENASPVSFTTKSFKGTNRYKAEDIPELDALIITHDHWDHLDYKTVLQLKSKAKLVITSLGVGAHLQRWGFDNTKVLEADWGDHFELGEGAFIDAAPARHFSGRGFKRNQSLWSSFILSLPGLKIYIGGDSGYDHHFKNIGEKFGPFDLAILENGQYNEDWRYIHMMPEEVVQAAKDLGAKKLIPVHWGKFSLSVHAWDEPIKRVTAAGQAAGVSILHPMIGEAVAFKKDIKTEKWWEGLE